MTAPRFSGIVAGFFLVLASAGCSRRPDILLVTIDTLRADRLGVHGSSLGLTPNLDRFGREALVFENAHTVVPITGPSLSSAFTSHYPHETKITDNGLPIPDKVPTLAEFLKSLGYETAAVVSNPVLRETGRLANGFDSYDDELPERQRYRDLPIRKAARTTDAALSRWRARGKKPFFLWVHYIDPHGPYEAPPEFLEVANRTTPPADRLLPVNATNLGLGGIPRYQYVENRRSSRDYLVRHNAAVAFLDREVGRLLNAPETDSLRRKGLVCVTSDHGESLGEHETWFAHGENVYEETLRIPWMVAGRGISVGRRKDLVSLIDLFPSLREVLGFKRDDSLRGLPVWRRPAPAERVLLAETYPNSSPAERYAAISPEATAILSQPGGWEYYRDARQLQDMGMRSPELRSLARLLQTQVLRNDLIGVVSPARGRILSTEALRQLRSLGYLQ